MSDSNSAQLDQHLFICTHEREAGKDSCGAKGAAPMRDELKAWAKKNCAGKVRINAAGCLGHCEQGIAAVAYPQGKWFLDLKSTDLEVLKTELLSQS